MKVSVERADCCGHEACVEICPEVFAIDDSDGLVELLVAEPPADLWDAATRAAEECPTDAIVIESGNGDASGR